ncbi:MAG: hypothetical protein MJK10_17100 [Pseudomonadales bacterium]|nr:hypothetical protein [Pseudomonadales bacterium]NRA17852.1 hypothetical protein [Oceanospirillaceae bacterium]
MSHIAVAIAQRITAQHQDIDSAIQGFTLPGGGACEAYKLLSSTGYAPTRDQHAAAT